MSFVGKESLLLSILIVLALTGGFVKILGGVLYGSRSLFIDALTSFANIVALIFIVYFHKISRTPPDIDHPYGHYRFELGGILSSIIAYSFVAGISIMELLYSSEYTVYFTAVYYAITGLLIYLLVIMISLRLGGSFKTYGLFTISELIESIIVIIACIGGALYNYIIDYVGAIILTGYIFYEVIISGKELLYIVTDKAPRMDILKIVRDLFEINDFKVTSLRIRIISPGKYSGDIKVMPRFRSEYEIVWDKIMNIKKYLHEKYNIDLVVEVTPPKKTS